MKKYYVLVDIGCIECYQESNVIGIFTNKDLVEEVKKDHEERQKAHWCGEHYFEIFEIDELDKIYGVVYENGICRKC